MKQQEQHPRRKHRKHGHAQEMNPWPVHPAWLGVLGLVAALLVLLVWMFR